MGTTLLELAVSVLAVWFVWRFILRQLRLPGRSASPGSGQDYADIAARLRPRPKSGAGAIALAEPEDDARDPDQATEASVGSRSGIGRRRLAG